MDFDSLGAFAMFISCGAIGVAAVWLVAYRMKLTADLERRRLGGGESAQEIGQLREEMREELDRQAAAIDDLHERLDFAERLLTRGGAEDGRSDDN